MCKLFLNGEVVNVHGGFGNFSMENWQVVAVVEIANFQRPRKKITVEYLAWFMENIQGSRLRSITVLENVRTREVKYRTHVEAGFEVYADYAVCNLFIHVI